ncbi:unnamed protein product [Cuscuta europaea]|uniref:BHLH domain-containing protein n=1 Tax=Cuscuta europaea TaxID=41803 RepID=A0A9P1ECI7_CUSEU|nr:unnamed protein product [Cuscuta europaea]
MSNGGGGGRDFQAAPIAPYSLNEIWPFAINAAAPAAYGLGIPANVSREHCAPLSDPLFSDQTVKQNSSRARKPREDDESAKGVSTSGNGLQNESDTKRLKTVCSNDNPESKVNGEGTSGKPLEQPAKPPEAPKDYIHVRARRGQATDSHSLAERARREKISGRMKILQDIVPGCNKFPAHTFDASTIVFGSQATRDYHPGASPDWLHMQTGGGSERTA